jgi:hypothetical protein
MIRRTTLALALGLLCASLGAASAGVQAWDPEKVKTLAEQLRVATNELYDAFYKQPVLGVAQNKVYYRLKQDIRSLRIEARHLSDALAQGAGRDETLPIWQDLMQRVRRAIEHGESVYTTQDVDQKAEAARAILDQLAPYYEPDAAATEPATR